MRACEGKVLCVHRKCVRKVVVVVGLLGGGGGVVRHVEKPEKSREKITMRA